MPVGTVRSSRSRWEQQDLEGVGAIQREPLAPRATCSERDPAEFRYSQGNLSHDIHLVLIRATRRDSGPGSFQESGRDSFRIVTTSGSPPDPGWLPQVLMKNW